MFEHSVPAHGTLIYLPADLMTTLREYGTPDYQMRHLQAIPLLARSSLSITALLSSRCSFSLPSRSSLRLVRSLVLILVHLNLYSVPLYAGGTCLKFWSVTGGSGQGDRGKLIAVCRAHHKTITTLALTRQGNRRLVSGALDRFELSQMEKLIIIRVLYSYYTYYAYSFGGM